MKSEAGKIGDLSDQDSLFEFKMEKGKELIRMLLTGRYEEKVLSEKENSQTTALLGDKFQGEVVVFKDEPILCSFVRK